MVVLSCVGIVMGLSLSEQPGMPTHVAKKTLGVGKEEAFDTKPKHPPNYFTRRQLARGKSAVVPGDELDSR